MVGPWMHPGRRRSVAFLQRIRSHQPLKKRSVPRSVKPDTLIPMDRFNDPLTLSEISTSGRTWRSQEFDGLESFWGQNLKNEQSETAETMAPLVIRNPVHSRKLEEPIERKREYWSENLLYIMRREGLIPKNRPVVMDRPTPEEPYRLSANVVRLLEQEPQLYIAKSSIKTPSFDSEISERTASDSIESWDNKPFPHSKARYGVARKTFDDSCHRSSHKCCDCGRSRTLNSFSGAEDFGRKAHSLTSLSEFKSRHPLYGQLRHYSATAARIPAEKIPKDRVAFDWDPVNYIPLRGRHVGSDEISQAISKLWIERRQKSRTFEHRLRMKRYLETRVFNDLLFTMTGSSANGFGFDDSDVDMCVEYKSNILPLARGSQVTVLKKMQAHMIGMQCFRKPTIIPAICPLLKFTYKQRSHISIVVEINASGNVGIRNTQLLYSYSRMDARVAPLVGACKHWATTMHIKDAQRGFLSSYSLTLMVIYFLQKVGVLPVLHQLVPEFETGRGFERNEKLLLPKWSSPNSQDVGSLFQNMLKFYCDFDFQENCISVREGASMGLEEAIENDPDIALSSKYTSRQMWGLVNIQEPFNFTNTARAVRHKANLKQMKKALKLSSELLHRKGAIDRLFGTSASDKETKIEKGP